MDDSTKDSPFHKPQIASHRSIRDSLSCLLPNVSDHVIIPWRVQLVLLTPTSMHVSAYFEIYTKEPVMTSSTRDNQIEKFINSI